MVVNGYRLAFPGPPGTAPVGCRETDRPWATHLSISGGQEAGKEPFQPPPRTEDTEAMTKIWQICAMRLIAFASRNK